MERRVFKKQKVLLNPLGIFFLLGKEVLMAYDGMRLLSCLWPLVFRGNSGKSLELELTVKIRAQISVVRVALVLELV